ncbi:hypothetical protein L798_09252 [Zootermopsis nevadensis]|uniref:MADF domain-containing protein n=1 Tax=Zootermopsis nevadensis TaxID=136037 RepID=A0A067RDN8_ZOONE|nr:hypothetical protein L798_09252 [Zootermopsis nevadensis]
MYQPCEVIISECEFISRNMTNVQVDIDYLISLIEARSVLWDKTSVLYKDRKETKNAWREVFVELKSDFEELEDKEKNIYAKEVMKRWVNVRDAFQKSIKKQKEATRSGAGKPTTKTYIYNAQLQFLRNVFLERKTEDTPSADIGQPEEANEKTPQNTSNNEVTQAIAKDFKTAVTRKRKSDNVELEMIQAPKDQSDRHLSFFRGIIPSLNTFDDDEILELQMSVLQKITSMKQRKKMVSYTQYSAEIHPTRINTSRQETTSTEGHLYQNVRPQLSNHRPSTSTGSSNKQTISYRRNRCM